MNHAARTTTLNWKVEDSAAIYEIPSWGGGYFAINERGHVVVRPDQTAGREVDLHDVVEGLKARDLSAPIVIRFSDILTHRLKTIAEAFANAISENDYQNRYRAVFPIKVNQQRLVVEEVVRAGADLGFGLEVGSKPELLVVMSMTQNNDRPIICNGFKDDSYIQAVVLAMKLGRKIIPVIENFMELQLLLKHCKEHNVRPQLGVRVKLSAEGAGRWRDSGGDKSKFGLFITEVLEVVHQLREAHMLDCLKLVHCHIGSQLQDIRRVKEAVTELAHIYAELHNLGAGLEYLDIGGGLGVDYDGSRTNYDSSMNYSLAEYASDVVYRIANVLNERKIPHPEIISESGRAMAAHHSVLVFNVLGASVLDQFKVDPISSTEDLPQPVRDLYDAYINVSERRLVECWNDALQAREQTLQLFNFGLLSLEHRGLAERLYWSIAVRIRDVMQKLPSRPEALEDLETNLSDTYFCNFSIFQSLPDSWAIGQVFPIMPIHRLNEKPTRRGILADITCDSDGKIDHFASVKDTKRSLELHELRQGEDYYLAAFMVGAYQETLGDLHNLFGDTHVVHIRLLDNNQWWIEETVKGDTALTVLGYMEYDTHEIYPRLARDCERAVSEQRLTVQEAQQLKRFYEAELHGYAYLETET